MFRLVLSVRIRDARWREGWRGWRGEAWCFDVVGGAVFHRAAQFSRERLKRQDYLWGCLYVKHEGLAQRTALYARLLVAQ